MRKQYSMRRTERGFDAWDVDRLIELTADHAVFDVAVDDIAELDEPYWFADSDEAVTVRKIVDHVRLVNEVDFAHPIILDPDNRVMDGMHRVARALLEGRSTVRAVRLDVRPPPDFTDCHPRDLPDD